MSCDSSFDSFGDLAMMDDLGAEQKRCTGCIGGWFGPDSLTTLNLESSTKGVVGLAKSELCGKTINK